MAISYTFTFFRFILSYFVVAFFVLSTGIYTFYLVRLFATCVKPNNVKRFVDFFVANRSDQSASYGPRFCVIHTTWEARQVLNVVLIDIYEVF